MRRFWVRVEGQSLVLFALFLTVLLGMVALAIDVGYLYYARTSFQRAADAGCLAGGSGLVISQTEARSRAIQFAGYNLSGNLAGAAINVSFPGSFTLRVDVNHPAVPLFFAPVIGWPTAPVSARAACQAQPAASTLELVPLGIYCNNPNGCQGVFPSASYNNGYMTMQRYCGNFFVGGAQGSTCGNSISNREIFVTGITFSENSMSNSVFRDETYRGHVGTVRIGDPVSALPGNRNGWKDGMINRLTEGRKRMVMAVVGPCQSPACRARNDVHQTEVPSINRLQMEIVDLVVVEVEYFGTKKVSVSGGVRTKGGGGKNASGTGTIPTGTTDVMTLKIIPEVISTDQFAAFNEGLGINSVFGVRLIE